MKNILIAGFVFFLSFAKAQKIDNIFVHLYTDSLKKGTYNYINIDGLLSDGNFIPLDSNDIIFWSSGGKFFGNSLWVDKNFNNERICIKATLRHNPAVHKEFTMFIKRKPDDERLKTSEELMREIENTTKKRSKKKA